MKLLVALLIALVSVSCVDTLYAQSLPVTLTVTWNANPVSDNVTGYEVSIDAAAPIGVIGTTTPITVTSFGHHVISVVAVNVMLTCDDPTQCGSGTITKSAPTTLGFTLNSSAAKPTGPKLSK